MKIPPYFFIFDVESVGLHGEAFAVAGGIWTIDGKNIHEFAFHTDSWNVNEGIPGDREWIAKNVSVNEASKPMASQLDLCEAFWLQWERAKDNYKDIVMAVECGWPVEANILEDCIRGENPVSRNYSGPYPLHEIATFMLCAGMDPMATYGRQPEELPAHEPLADARLSARLLFESLMILEKKNELAWRYENLNK